MAADGLGEPYAPFRPRLARLVSYVVAALVVLALTALAVALPSINPDARLGDRLAIAGFGLLVAWFLHREASVAAVPDAEGLVVRNLLVTRKLEWTQIVSVRLGERPWVQLDLTDGDTIAVMAIQRADRASVQAEARRLATLVARHSGEDPPTPPAGP